MTPSGPSTDDLLRTIGVKQVTVEWLEEQVRRLREVIEAASEPNAQLQPPDLKVVPPPED